MKTLKLSEWLEHLNPCFVEVITEASFNLRRVGNK